MVPPSRPAVITPQLKDKQCKLTHARAQACNELHMHIGATPINKHWGVIESIFTDWWQKKMTLNVGGLLYLKYLQLAFGSDVVPLQLLPKITIMVKIIHNYYPHVFTWQPISNTDSVLKNFFSTSSKHFFFFLGSCYLSGTRYLSSPPRPLLRKRKRWNGIFNSRTDWIKLPSITCQRLRPSGSGGVVQSWHFFRRVHAPSRFTWTTIWPDD